MKITYSITMASALLLAAGCAHEESTYSSTETGYSSGRMSEYNHQKTTSTPSVGGSYSADGSYSSGGGGAYSSRPIYSGTVGADGAYTPDATSESSAPAGNYAAGAGVESDNVIIAQVRESLRQDPEIALIVPNIQISAHNGAIILNGSVQSEAQRRQILSKVQNISGVITVNNQLNVMAGPNGQNSNLPNQNGSPLNPTSNNSDSQRLYKDANGSDASTNNALNSTSGQNGQSQLYQQNSQSGANSNDQLNPTSRSDSSTQIYHDSNQGQNAQQQNSNLSTNNLTPTSRDNGGSQMYQTNPGETLPNQNNNNVQTNPQNP